MPLFQQGPQGTFRYTGGIGLNGAPVMGGWEVTQSHGQTPNIFHVAIPMTPGSLPEKNGDVILNYGNVEIPFKDCTIDQITQDIGGALIWNVTILDRRYKWRFGKISGAYNVRWRNGTDIREETKKKPSELGKLCLDAMGETGYDVSALQQFDDKDWPEINWNANIPAEVLFVLCERYGLRPNIDWQQNVVVVYVVGKGQELDLSLPFTANSETFDPPEKPGKLVLICGPSSVQRDIPLEPVMLDVDQKIKYPNQVTYTPPPYVAPPGQAFDMTSGTYADTHWAEWANYSSDFLSNISVPYLRQLAERTLLKWYRVVPPATMEGLKIIAGDAEDTDGIDDFGNIAEDSQRSWLPQISVQGEQNDRLDKLADPQATEFDEYNKEISSRPLPAWVYGVFYDNTLAANNNLPNDQTFTVDENGNESTSETPLSGLKKLNPLTVFSPAQQGASTVPNQDVPATLQEAVVESGFYPGGFEVDGELGIVKFAEQVEQVMAAQNAGLIYRQANGSAIDPDISRGRFPATLWLRTRFFVNDKATRAPIRYQKTRILDSDPNNKTSRYVVKDDLIFKLTYRFGGQCNTTVYPPTFDVLVTENNQDVIDAAADAYLDQIVQEYETRQPQTIEYVGFLPMTLDGAIRQITWRVDEEGKAFTRVSRDQEELHIVRDYRDRRLAERLKALADEANKQALPAPRAAREGA